MHTVILRAAIGNAETRQQFRLEVVGVAADKPNVLAPFTVPLAYVGRTFTIDLDATDPEGTTVTYFASGLPAGATINAASGVFTWTPPAALLGQTVTLRMGVRDQSGLQVSSDVQLRVIASDSANRPPQIVSCAVGRAYVDEPFVYKLLAIDAGRRWSCVTRLARLRRRVLRWRSSPTTSSRCS